MRRFVFGMLMLAVSACSGFAGLPEEGLGDKWITEDRIAPGRTDRDRILHSFPIENADGWTVEKGKVSVEKGDKFYGEACLRLSGPKMTFISREAEFTVNKLTFVTCAFLREVGCWAWFMLRDAGGQWHEAIANSGHYWTHGYQHVTGRFTGRGGTQTADGKQQRQTTGARPAREDVMSLIGPSVPWRPGLAIYIRSRQTMAFSLRTMSLPWAMIGGDQLFPPRGLMRPSSW